jgi:hypothetical protein
MRRHRRIKVFRLTGFMYTRRNFFPETDGRFQTTRYHRQETERIKVFWFLHMCDEDDCLKEPQYLNDVFDYLVSDEVFWSVDTYHDDCFDQWSAYRILPQSQSFRDTIERSIR